MEKITKKEQVLISIFLIAILAMSSGSMVAFAKSNAHVVKPNGTDDTADIQAALNSCVGAGPQCTVQLVAGTYYISQIAVSGFQGSFVGMGQGVTVIQALPNLPDPNPLYNTPTTPFWAEPPGPSNPWPALFTFVGGTFLISQMTITDQNSAPLVSPGWVCCGSPYYTALDEGILIAGQQASVTVDHVSVIGTSGDEYGTNMNYAIEVDSHMLPEGWTDALADMLPLTGAFSVTNSVFDTVATGTGGGFLTSATFTLCHNKFTNSPYPMYFLDWSNTKILACGNQVTNVQDFGSGFFGLQSAYKSGLLPSAVYIIDNTFQVSQGSTGIFLADFGSPSSLSAVISGNTIKTDTSCGCYDPTSPQYYSAIISSNLKSSVVSLNTINGAGAAGIYISGGPGQVAGNVVSAVNTGIQVDVANGVNVAANLVKNSAQWGIAVTDGSGNNRIIGNFVHNSGAFDLYQDTTSTGNVWHGNFCSTSSPPGLC